MQFIRLVIVILLIFNVLNSQEDNIKKHNKVMELMRYYVTVKLGKIQQNITIDNNKTLTVSYILKERIESIGSSIANIIINNLSEAESNEVKSFPELNGVSKDIINLICKSEEVVKLKAMILKSEPEITMDYIGNMINSLRSDSFVENEKIKANVEGMAKILAARTCDAEYFSQLLFLRFDIIWKSVIRQNVYVVEVNKIMSNDEIMELPKKIYETGFFKAVILGDNEKLKFIANRFSVSEKWCAILFFALQKSSQSLVAIKYSTTEKIIIPYEYPGNDIIEKDVEMNKETLRQLSIIYWTKLTNSPSK